VNLRLALGGIVAALVLTGAMGLYWKGRMAGAAAERPKTAVALDRAATATLETEGARASAARVEVVVRQREAAAQSVARITPQILQSEAAHAPLDHDRLARLRDHDLELCKLADLVGCSTSN
jgi:hypothetical protein